MFLFLFLLPGDSLKKKQHPPSLTPVVPPLEKKLQSVTPVQTSQPVPLKVPLEDPSPDRARQVSVGAAVPWNGGGTFCVLGRGDGLSPLPPALLVGLGSW